MDEREKRKTGDFAGNKKTSESREETGISNPRAFEGMTVGWWISYRPQLRRTRALAYSVGCRSVAMVNRGNRWVNHGVPLYRGKNHLNHFGDAAMKTSARKQVALDDVCG